MFKYLIYAHFPHRYRDLEENPSVQIHPSVGGGEKLLQESHQENHLYFTKIIIVNSSKYLMKT